MANFMGPMAPPQAAPNAPPQLDIRTNPSQRAQFKEFMQGMNRPVMPPTTAPIAPMLPAPMPSPMDQIDIFAPAQMANPAPMPMPMQMPAPMPMQGGIMGAVPFEDGGPVGMQRGGVTFKSGESFESGRGIAEQQRERAERAAREERYGPASDSSYFGDIPSDLRTSGTYTPPDGGRDSDPIQSSGEIPSDAIATIAAMDAAQENFVPGSVLTGTLTSEPATDMSNLIARNQQTQQDIQNLLASMGDIDESAGDFAGVSPVASVDPLLSGPQSSSSLLDLIDPGNVPNPLLDAVIGFDRKQQDALSEVEALIGPQPRNTGPADQSVIDFINRNPQPPADSGVRTAPPPTSDPYGMPGDPDPAFVQEQAFDRAIGNMFATPVTYKTARGNVTGTALDDLSRRMGGNVDATGDKPNNMFGGLGKIVVDALLGVGRKKAEDIFTNIESGRPGVIDAGTGQIQGYIGDNILGFGRAYTGRAGYDPFAIGADATFDPSRNAFIVNRQQENVGEDAQQRNRASGQAPVTPPPVTDPADTTPPPLMITPPTTGLPPSGPSPTDVLVPSTRTNVPVTVPSILPTQGTAPTFLPQSFLDLLASFNRPAPRAMQDGGAVLDKAADDFLEALKVA